MIDRTTSARFPGATLVFSQPHPLPYFDDQCPSDDVVIDRSDSEDANETFDALAGEKQIAKHHGRCHALGGGGQQPQPTESSR